MKKNSHIAITILFFAFLMPSILFAEQIDLPKDADGWTVFTPSNDSRICYIAANGNDTTAQYYSANDATVGSDPFKPVGPIKAYATFAAAYADTRTGYPDWILFKRGDIFTGGLGTVNRSGKDSASPFLISAYGSSGDSPVIQLNSTRGMLIGASISYFSISGLHFYNIDRDPIAGGDWSKKPDDAIFGYFVNRTFNGALFEGCKFRFFSNGIYLVSDANHDVNDIMIRRCTFLYNSFGTMMNQTDGIKYEENIYYHNGWWDQDNSSDKTHNVYHQGASNDVFRNNLFLCGSSANIKITNPYGEISGPLKNVVIENNLLVDGEVAISAGHNYQPGGGKDQAWPFRIGNIRISNNIVTQVGRSNPTNRGLGWGTYFSGFDGGIISHNLFINQVTARVNDVRVLYIEGDFRDTSVYSNIIFNLQFGVGIRIEDNSQASYGNLFTKNDIQLAANGKQIVAMYYDGLDGFNFTQNTYYTSVPDGSRFYYINRNISDDSWKSIVGGDFGPLSEKSYPDTTRDVDTYMTSIGKTGTVDGFMAACSAQERYNWDPRLTADTVNSWIRRGYWELMPPQNVTLIN